MSDQLAVARLEVARTRPYYASVLWALQPVPMEGFAKTGPGPIGVDARLRLYYDPEEIGKWQPTELSTVMIHEIGHVLRNHAGRIGDRKDIVMDSNGGMGSLWNIAGDLEINDDLEDEGLKFPKGTIHPERMTPPLPKGLMAEEYYELLLKNMKKVSVPGGAGSGKCGSAAHGQREAHEGEIGGPQGGEAKGTLSDAEIELIRQKVAEDVQTHVKNRGTVPAWLERWAKERLTSKVDWRRLLAAFIRRACGDVRGMVDYTYRRPSRRASSLPEVIMPALRAPEPHVAVVVDTSGSMSEKELSQALAEIAKVLESQGNRGVTVLAVDAAVHTTQKVFRAEQVKLAGGGGTDMRLGIEAAEAIKPRCNVIILVTDGETPYPAQPTKVPLIVALTQPKPGYSAPPSWAKVVEVIPDGT